MNDQTLTVTVAPDGSSTVEVDGARGDLCLELTREIEEAIGDVKDRKKKPEFYQGNTGGTHQKRRT